MMTLEQQHFRKQERKFDQCNAFFSYSRKIQTNEANGFQIGVIYKLGSKLAVESRTPIQPYPFL